MTFNPNILELAYNSKSDSRNSGWTDIQPAQRRVVIQRRMEDLQLGVECYQKKLNLTKTDTYRSNLRNKTTYTSHSDPYGIIYVDQSKRKRLMRTDELLKFNDGMLNDVRTALYDIAVGLRLDYLPMRRWSYLDKKRARVMVHDIDKQLYQRRLMRNLEKFTGGRPYGEDLQLLERTYDLSYRYYGEELAETGSPEVIVYGYDGLPMQLVARPSPDYVPGPEHPPSPDYLPGPEHPPSPVEIPYVPKPEYPDYLAPFNNEAPLEDQPLPADASPVAASPGYVADSDPDEDPKEDPEDDHADYPSDGGDGDDEPSDDDDTDDEDLEEEPFEDEEDDEEEEEEHLAMADSSDVSIIDPVLPAGDTEALEADEPTPTPRSPRIIIPFSYTRLRRLPLPSPLTTSPTSAGAPLGCRAARIRMRALLPSTSRRTGIFEADVPPRKRTCLTTPAPRFEVGESSAAGVARQLEISPTTLEGVDQRVTELDTTVRQRTDEFEIRFKEARDERALLRAQVNTLFRDRPDHHCTVMLLDRDAMYACEAWAGSKDKSLAIAAHVRTLEAQIAVLIAHTSSLHTQLTIAL
nr:hypothetical protein [Tanacetum cinerariifolium]